MLKHIKSLAGQSIIYGVGGLLPKAIGFLLIPLYTHYLTPADYGILAFTTTINSILVILFQLGMDSAVTRFYYDFLDKPDEGRRYNGTIWLTLTFYSLLAALFLTWQGEAIFSLLFKETPFYPYGLYTVWISFFTVASTIPLVLFRVREKATYYVIMTVGRFIVTTLAIIYFVAYLKQGAVGSLKGQLLTSLLFFIPFSLITLWSSRLSFYWKYLKTTLVFSLPLIPHQLSGWALSVSDRILLERNVSLDQLGLYSLGYRMAMILDLLLLSINMSWSPFFYRLASTEEDAPQTFSRITTYFTVLMLSLSLPVALLSSDLIKIMANPAFWSADQVVPVVVLAFIAHGFYFMFVNQLFFAKKTRKLASFTVTAALVNISLNIWLIPIYGIMAAAWTTTIGYTLLTVLVYFESKRTYPVPYEYRRISIALLAALITYIFVNLIHIPNPVTNLVVRTVAIAIFPLLLLSLRFFTPSELKGIKSLPSRVQRWIAAQKASHVPNEPPTR